MIHLSANHLFTSFPRLVVACRDGRSVFKCNRPRPQRTHARLPATDVMCRSTDTMGETRETPMPRDTGDHMRFPEDQARPFLPCIASDNLILLDF